MKKKLIQILSLALFYCLLVNDVSAQMNADPMTYNDYPTVSPPPFLIRCTNTCPPFTRIDPMTCNCLPNLDECVVFQCDDGDPCTNADIEERMADGEICVPCAGVSQEILSIEVENMRDCNPSTNKFAADIVVTFNSVPVLEDFIITGDAYFNFTESDCIITDTTVTIENIWFNATGERITLHGIFNNRLSCSFTKNGLGGQALEPCKGYLNSTESHLVAGFPTTHLANNNASKVAVTDFNNRALVSDLTTTPFAKNSTSNISTTDMTVYPNPAQDELFVQFAGLDLTSAVNVQLFDMSGRQQLVKEINVSTTLIPINIGDLENGLYLIRLEQNGTVLMDRVVKAAR